MDRSLTQCLRLSAVRSHTASTAEAGVEIAPNTNQQKINLMLNLFKGGSKHDLQPEPAVTQGRVSNWNTGTSLGYANKHRRTEVCTSGYSAATD